MGQNTPELDELLSQHTATPPSLSFEQCLSKLRSGTAEGKADQAAILGYLRYALTPLSASIQVPPDAAELNEFAIRMLDAVPREGQRTNLIDTAFNVAHPGHLSLLAEPLLRVASPEALCQLIIEKLQGSNELHIINALNLLYFVMSAAPEELDGTTLHAIQVAIDKLKMRDPPLLQITQMTLQEFEMPHVMA